MGGKVSKKEDFEKVIVVKKSDGAMPFDAYVTGPKNAPGVVVIQEWWGVDYEIKNHAKTLAQKGYRCLVPDLYRGKMTLDQAEAHHLMEGLDWPGAVKDIEASAQWLKDNGSAKVGVLGFCMGGALALASAVKVDTWTSGQISAAVPFYGIPPPTLADPAEAKVPVQAHFGSVDGMTGFSDPDAAKVLKEKLEASGVAHELYFYEGQGHAFMNSSPEAVKRKEGMQLPPHDQKAVNLAWERVDAWFSKYLK